MSEAPLPQLEQTLIEEPAGDRTPPGGCPSQARRPFQHRCDAVGRTTKAGLPAAVRGISSGRREPAGVCSMEEPAIQEHMLDEPLIAHENARESR